MAFWLKVISIIGELLVKFGLKKKADADASKIDALEKTVDSVNESLAVEREIRSQQSTVDKIPSDVQSSDGGLNFDKFNEVK